MGVRRPPLGRAQAEQHPGGRGDPPRGGALRVARQKRPTVFRPRRGGRARRRPRRDPGGLPRSGHRALQGEAPETTVHQQPAVREPQGDGRPARPQQGPLRQEGRLKKKKKNTLHFPRTKLHSRIERSFSFFCLTCSTYYSSCSCFILGTCRAGAPWDPVARVRRVAVVIVPVLAGAVLVRVGIKIRPQSRGSRVPAPTQGPRGARSLQLPCTSLRPRGSPGS